MTNTSSNMDKMYGGATSSLFGYSHLTGGYPDLQCDLARVPIADVNLLKLPDELSDEQAILLSDVACTGYQAALFADLAEECHESLVVMGAGPIGLTAAYFAKTIFKCRNVVVADPNQARLDLFREGPLKELGVLTVNVESTKDSSTKILQMLNGERPDSVIDATGFRYATTW